MATLNPNFLYQSVRLSAKIGQKLKYWQRHSLACTIVLLMIKDGGLSPYIPRYRWLFCLITDFNRFLPVKETNQYLIRTKVKIDIITTKCSWFVCMLIEKHTHTHRKFAESKILSSACGWWRYEACFAAFWTGWHLLLVWKCKFYQSASLGGSWPTLSCLFLQFKSHAASLLWRLFRRP